MGLLLAAPPAAGQGGLFVRIGLQYEPNGGRPIFRAITSLPDGVPMMATLTRAGIGLAGQAHGATAEGRASFGPFSASGQPMPPGLYVLEVSSAIVDLWPAEAAALAGSGGSRMVGDVERTPIGVIAMHRTTVNIR